MLKRRHNNSLHANRPLYHLIGVLLKPAMALKYGFRLTKRTLPEKGKGFVAICNHCSNLDFLFAFAAMYPRPMSAITATYFFHDKRLAWLLELFACIPKDQFTPDALAVRDMQRVVAAGGGILLFPEGEVNGTGRSAPFPESTARLMRLLGMPVYAIKLKGSYLTRPKWADKPRRGAVRCSIEPVMTAVEAKTLPRAEVYSKLAASIYHDDYEWQRTAKIPFVAGKGGCAAGIWRVLYKCPRCGAEGHITGKGSSVYCEACGNLGIMDMYGLMRPASKDDAIIPAVSDWAEYQRAELERELSSPDAALEAECSLLLHPDSSQLAHTRAGHGTVTLTRSSVTYRGTRGDESVVLEFDHATIFKFPFTAGAYFEIPNSREVVAIAPDELWLVEKFVLALPVIHKLNKKAEEERK